MIFILISCGRLEGVSGEYYDFIILLLQNGGCGIIFNLIFLVNNSVTYERVKTGS